MMPKFKKTHANKELAVAAVLGFWDAAWKAMGDSEGFSHCEVTAKDPGQIHEATRFEVHMIQDGENADYSRFGWAVQLTPERWLAVVDSKFFQQGGDTRGTERARLV